MLGGMSRYPSGSLEAAARRVSFIWPLVLLCTTVGGWGLAAGQWSAVRRTEAKLDRALFELERNDKAHAEIGARLGMLETALLAHVQPPQLQPQTKQ